MSRRLVHLTNIPTPYRVCFMNHLCHSLATYGWQLSVLYCAWREPGRNWPLPVEGMQYDWKLLPGFTFHARGVSWHVNPTVTYELQRLAPAALLTAGSWCMPSAVVTSVPQFMRTPMRIFWSESHESAVLHPRGPIAKVRQFATRRYTHFAVPNAASRDFILKDTGVRADRIMLLPNTIEEEKFAGTTLPSDRQAEKLRVLIVASIESRKGFRELNEELSLLEEGLRDRIHVDVIGEGPIQSEVSDGLAGMGVSACFHGYQDAKYISEMLSSCDAFLLPSLLDPNPLSVIEAISSGRPVLVSRRCGNALDCVEEGVNGFLFSPVVRGDLASVLRKFISLNASARTAMGQASRRKYRERFSLVATADSFAMQLVEQSSVWFS